MFHSKCKEKKKDIQHFTFKTKLEKEFVHFNKWCRWLYTKCPVAEVSEIILVVSCQARILKFLIKLLEI